MPRRTTDVDQPQGGGNIKFTLTCDLDRGDWERPQDSDSKTDVIPGQVFYGINHYSKTEPWQWLDTDKMQFKVMIESRFGWRRRGEKIVRTIDITFTEFSAGDKSEESPEERFGFDL